jgi:hypothetical protein
MPIVHGNTLNLGDGTGTARPLVLPASARDKHLYVAGATGAGKSKFLEHLIRQDIVSNRQSGCGLMLIDPHGALYDHVLAWMAFTNLQRPVTLIDMREADWVVSYNVLREGRQTNPSVIVDNFVQAMAHVWGQSGTDQTPQFARWAANMLRALYEKRLTLADAVHLFDDDRRVRAALTAQLSDLLTRRDWERANEYKPAGLEDVVGSTLNRLRRFLTNEVMRCMFGQPDVSLDLGGVIEEGGIVLVSLAREKGRVSKEDAELFATLLLTDLWTAAQERGKKQGIRPFYVYLDEFQRFITPTIAENLDEARGFGLHLTLAHQFPKQLADGGVHGRRLYNSIMENASSKVVFRLTDTENLEPLARSLFMGVMDPDEIKSRIYSTKVMGYREETRTTRSRSDIRASAYAEHESESSGSSRGEGESFDDDADRLGYSQSLNDHSGFTSGRTHSHQNAVTESTGEVPMLIPEMGSELSSVEYRSLDEQLHRAMVALFDQEQRQYTARLVGMKAPVSVMTPRVEDTLIYPHRVREFVERLMASALCALRAPDAYRQLRERESKLIESLLGSAHLEPKTSRKRVK